MKLVELSEQKEGISERKKWWAWNKL